jgi:hypothetical protein
MLIKIVPNVRRTEDAKNIVFMLGSIFKGKGGLLQLVVGRYTDSNERIQTVNITERKRYCRFFLKCILSLLRYQVLSAVTTMVTVVAWSELTDFAVVVISKSKLQAPATSKVKAVGSGDAKVIVFATSPML